LKEKWKKYQHIINTALYPEHEKWMRIILAYGKQCKYILEQKPESEIGVFERKQKKRMSNRFIIVLML
jgi:hypothetical protein